MYVNEIVLTCLQTFLLKKFGKICNSRLLYDILLVFNSCNRII